MAKPKKQNQEKEIGEEIVEVPKVDDFVPTSITESPSKKKQETPKHLRRLLNLLKK